MYIQVVQQSISLTQVQVCKTSEVRMMSIVLLSVVKSAFTYAEHQACIQDSIFPDQHRNSELQDQDQDFENRVSCDQDSTLKNSKPGLNTTGANLSLRLGGASLGYKGERLRCRRQRQGKESTYFHFPFWAAKRVLFISM